MVLLLVLSWEKKLYYYIQVRVRFPLLSDERALRPIIIVLFVDVWCIFWGM